MANASITYSQTTSRRRLNGFHAIFSKLVVLLLLAGQSLYAATVSIIIDDVGDNRGLALRSLELDPRVALSILPHTPFSQEIAQMAVMRGNDVLLHQPMESYRDNHLLGPGPITTDMNRGELMQTLHANLDAIPGVIGINNHMGSKLTEDPVKMSWVMSVLINREKFFIDSKTSAASVASDMAERWQVPHLSRHIFLDHTDTPEGVARQFKRLIQHAHQFGHAVAIGHPKVNTLDYLEQAIPELAREGIELIPVHKKIATNPKPIPTLMALEACDKLSQRHSLNILKGGENEHQCIKGHYQESSGY